ncbi:MAG: bifunctional riboflavin kinase/FAD synthetase [Gammaproteobacteria bacterium]|nr:bifunctional riboflavin kinase/FAD synthetase [Gammaproteobacteria bacterium]
MRLIRKPRHRIPELADGCVATIGAFDGLHIGHRRILDRVLVKAREFGLPALVMSFDPTPKEFFIPDNPPARLMCMREKFMALDEIGIDVFFCPRFNRELSRQTPDEFIDEFLVRLTGLQHMVIGDDFRFAHKRSGSVADLQRRGAEQGFTVEQVGSVIERDVRVASSLVRERLRDGDCAGAAELLGRPYRMSGQVVEGEKLGRTLGMPTANVRLKRMLSPVRGIFAVRVGGADGDKWLNGVASVGTRPTVDGVEPLLEVHIFDFDRDIYGAQIQVEFVAKLRDEEKFPDLESLKEQMFRDAAEARAMLRA